MILAISLRVLGALYGLFEPPPDHDPSAAHSARGDSGQATAEYALVLLGAAAIAVLLVAWATAGGGAGKIGQLLDRVLDAITSKVA